VAEAYYRDRTAPVRVLIADDDETFCALVKRLLGSAVEVVGEAADGETAVRIASDLAPDVVIMDVEIPTEGGIVATRQIKAAKPETRVLMVTAHEEEAYLDSTGKAGADAFLPKRLIREELLSSIKTLAESVFVRSGSGRQA
jgi:DNA-binding NarL/FixJ family response regulator